MNLANHNATLAESQSVSELESRFRALITANSDMLYSMSPDWSVMMELKGRGFLPDASEPVTDWMQKYIPSEDREMVRAAVAQAIRDKKIFQLEHRVKLADGGLGWTSSRAVPILDRHGKIIEWFGVASDVTERRRMEEKLREAKEQSEQQRRLYETIASGTPDLIYVFDLDYRFTYANQALLTMWGKSWEEAIGKRLIDNGYEDWHAAMHEREIDQVRATKKTIRGEVAFPHAILGRRIYDYIFTPVFNEHGDVEAVAGTTRDITDIRNAEIALSESEARFRTMAEGVDVLIALIDESGNGVYFNNHWYVITGKPVSALMQRGWIDLIYHEDKDSVLNILSTGIHQQKHWQCEFRLPDSYNNQHWVVASGVPRFGPDGSFAGYISSAVDITQIKENEQRKNDFISMVSHELKTPLTSSIGYVQILETKAMKDQDSFAGDLLKRTERQLNKMAGLISSFLNVSRLESGKLHIDRQPFDMALLLTEVEEEAKAIFSRHRLVFKPVDSCWVEADRDKIFQVIQNLISNAVKYSAQESTVTISCIRCEKEAHLSVSDEGPGIKSEDVPRIFERFYRIENNNTKSISGFGIGLYLCSEIIKGHDGIIGVNNLPGKGSDFYFTLPLMTAKLSEKS